MKNYWLFKTEPHKFSIDDLKNSPDQITRWDGIRNYQARNLLRDNIKVGDEVFIYHSQCKVPGIVGLAKVVTAAYADPAQFDPEHEYYDIKATQDKPRWVCLDVQYLQTYSKTLALKDIRSIHELQEMVLLKQGRLSIQPVTSNEANVILGRLA